MAKKLIPFSWLPGHWGLAGKTRAAAQAEYELEGYERDEKLLSIRRDEMSEEDYNQRLLDLMLKYDKITRSEYNRELANMISDEKLRALSLLGLDLRDGKIGDTEYSKQCATLKGEPWVTVLNMDFDKGNSLEGSFELDWNDAFVAKLKAEGYKGISDDVIVNQWFMEVCRNVAMEEFDGTGDFTADSEANLDAMRRWSIDVDVHQNGRKGYK